jgi:hypothetical protein
MRDILWRVVLQSLIREILSRGGDLEYPILIVREALELEISRYEITRFLQKCGLRSNEIGNCFIAAEEQKHCPEEGGGDE